MPRKALFTKKEITQKAYEIIRKNGIHALTARSLAKALGSSPRPLFTIYNSMSEIIDDVKVLARQRFEKYTADVFEYDPAFKEYSKRLISFAHHEEHIFRLIFLDHKLEHIELDNMTIRCIQLLSDHYGISSDDAIILLKQCWIYTCGLAIINNNLTFSLSDDMINEWMSRNFFSALTFIKSGSKFETVNPRHLTEEEMKKKYVKQSE